MHAVGFARGQTARTLAWQLGRQLGYGPTEPDELLGRLRADPRPVLLAVTDLHQAGRGPAHLPSGRPGTVVDDLLAPLLRLPDLRMLIETEARELARTPDAFVLTLEPADDALPVGTPLPGPRPEGAATPAAPAPGRDWRTASADEREHALDRALTTGAAHELLRDPGYLVYGSVPAITATLADPAVPLPPSLRAVWADAAPALSAPDLPDSQRAAVLHAAAVGTDPRLAEYLRPLAQSGPWTTSWSRPSRPADALALLPGAAGSDGTLVSANGLGQLARIALADGQVVASPSSGGTPWQPVALTAVTDDCLLALDGSGTLHPLPLATGAQVPMGLGYLALHHNSASLASLPERPTAVASTPRHVAVADGQGRVRLWPLYDIGPGPRGVEPHRTGVTAVACLDVSDAAVLVVTGGLDGTVRLWDTEGGDNPPDPVERRAAVPAALAVADTHDAGPVLAVAWSDRRLHLWHLLSGRRAVVPALHDIRALVLTAGGHLVSAGHRGVRSTRLDLTALWAREAGIPAG